MPAISHLDRFLARHAADFLGGQTPAEAETNQLVFWILPVLGVAGLLFLPLPGKLLALVALAGFGVIWFRKRQTPPVVEDPAVSALRSLYQSVYGKWGVQVDGGVRPGEEPSPIRRSELVLSPETFQALDQAAQHVNRVFVSLGQPEVSAGTRDVLASRVKQAMLEFVQATSKTPSAPGLKDTIRQFQEIADRLEGASVALPTPVDNLTGLGEALMTLRAEEEARVELRNEGG